MNRTVPSPAPAATLNLVAAREASLEAMAAALREVAAADRVDASRCVEQCGLLYDPCDIRSQQAVRIRAGVRVA